MDENIKNADLEAEQLKEDSESFETLIIDNIRYKTRLNKKYLQRKPYTPPNPKLINALIPGTIRQVYIKNGKKLKPGEKMLELEAMKMINTIFAEENCVIEKIYVTSGELVSRGQLLIKLK